MTDVDRVSPGRRIVAVTVGVTVAILIGGLGFGMSGPELWMLSASTTASLITTVWLLSSRRR